MKKKNILLLSPICEESHLRKNRIYAESLFYNSKRGKTPLAKKIEKASDIVKETFTVDGLTTVLNEFDRYLEDCSTYNYLESGKFKNSIYQLISNPNFLLLAQAKLIERGNYSYGIDEVPTENITLGGIRKLSLELANHKYTPKPVRKVFIPKPGKVGQKRPIGISSSRDKIVQKAIKMLIEPIFEKVFRNCSYGFRPGRNCHSNLKQIDLKWRRMVWFIEVDIVQAFEKIQHQILVRTLKKYLRDQRVIGLISKLIKIGYINWENISESKLEIPVGTSQGSIISPILCNIYFHALDEYIEDVLCSRFNVGRVDKVNEEYKERGRITGSTWNPIFQHIKEISPKVNSSVIRNSLMNIIKVERIQDNVPYYAIDDNHRKLKYVRYADDFLLGFVGPKKDAFKILQEIAYFLESELELRINIEKSGIKHHEDGVIYLGYHLHGRFESKLKFTEEGQITQRQKSNWIKFGIPVFKLIKRYSDKGFFQKARKGNQDKYVARRVDKWLFLPSDVEIVKRFNATARGLAEYYSGSKYPSALNEFWSMLKRSLALTLAHRHKLKSARKALNKWGNNLQVADEVYWSRPLLKGGKWLSPKAKQGQLKEMMTWQPAGNYFPKTLSSILVAQELKCSIPNCPNMAQQWHHIKHRKKSKMLHKRDQLRVALTSKQIPVCKQHHYQIHQGKYDGPSIRKLPGYTSETIQDALNL